MLVTQWIVVQRTFITIGIVCSLILGASQALAYVARISNRYLLSREKPDGEVTSFSTTASLLQPLVVTLPILGFLVALQRGFTGSSLISLASGVFFTE